MSGMGTGYNAEMSEPDFNIFDHIKQHPIDESTAFCDKEFPKAKGMKTITFTVSGYLRRVWIIAKSRLHLWN